MNQHELRDEARYVGGQIEKAAGDAMDKRDWQIDGVARQVMATGEALFSRARSLADDIGGASPRLVRNAQERLEDAARAMSGAVRRGSAATGARVGDDGGRLMWAAIAAVGGYLAGPLIHGREA